MNRLQKICSFITYAPVIADIGCDHGKISEFIVLNKLCRQLIVNDISPLSLEKAKNRLLKIDAGGIEIVFSNCDGRLIEDKPDLCVIAGVGGRTIADIIGSLRPKSLVLSPQNAQNELRQALFNLGYKVTNDETVQEGRHFYDVLEARIVSNKTDLQPPCETELNYGYFYKVKSDALYNRLLKDYGSLTKYKKTDVNIKKLKIIGEALEWQK